MKPAPFGYQSAAELDDALKALGAPGAGGFREHPGFPPPILPAAHEPRHLRL